VTASPRSPKPFGGVDQREAVTIVEEFGIEQVLAFDAVEHDLVPPILHPRFSQAFRASCESFEP
jgi:hypothetical protein